MVHASDLAPLSVVSNVAHW